MIKKFGCSLLLIAIYGLFVATFGRYYEIAKTPLVGALSVDQLQDSNSAYINSMWSIDIIKSFSPNGIAFWILIGGLLMLWKSDIKKLFTITAIMLALYGILFPYNANAYYSKTDYTEVVEILPNQTAFLIPETGANKTEQASFMSVDYLNANKAAMKRITIPHVKLTGSSMWADYYVPGSRLLIIDRTPCTREWVGANDRGTTSKDESFRFESKESINISTGIVISAFVKEEDAAKFVYWFGAKKQVDATTDEERFASVIYARSLAEVVDDNVRRKVQAVLAREFGSRTLIDDAAQKADIIKVVEKETQDNFAPMGITVSFVGYAESLNYDPEIQKAINNVFLATKKAEANTQLMASIPYEQAIVNINFINAQAEAIKAAGNKWDGKLELPSWVILPQGLGDTLTGWLGKGKAPVTVTK